MLQLLTVFAESPTDTNPLLPAFLSTISSKVRKSQFSKYSCNYRNLSRKSFILTIANSFLYADDGKQEAAGEAKEEKPKQEEKPKESMQQEKPPQKDSGEKGGAKAELKLDERPPRDEGKPKETTSQAPPAKADINSLHMHCKQRITYASTYFFNLKQTPPYRKSKALYETNGELSQCQAAHAHIGQLSSEKPDLLLKL